MKKISLFLALIILTCAVFAACGESTESTSDTPKANSEASEASENESSKNDASKPVSEDEQSESTAEASSEPEESKPALEITGENIAKGKTYTVSGTGTGYIEMESQWGAMIYNASLTDGIAHEELTFGDTNNWFGLYYTTDAQYEDHINSPLGIGTIIIDLENEAAVTGVKIHLGNYADNAVVSPTAVTLALSADGEAYTSAGEFEIAETGEGSPNNLLVYWSELPVDSVNARYVKITFTLGGVFAFLNEIEVYA